jgi:uncharacterized protein (DUF885 family)
MFKRKAVALAISAVVALLVLGQGTVPAKADGARGASTGSAVANAAAQTTGLAARRQALDKLVAEEWEYELRESPEMATVIGDYRYNDRWSDFSLQHVQQSKLDAQKWIARFEAVDTSGFPEQEKLNQVLMLRQLKSAIEGIDLKTYEMPVDQFNGLQLLFAQFVSLVPVDSTKHYEDYATRLRTVPQVFEQVTELMKLGEKGKLMPPRFLLEKVVEQCKAIDGPAGEASVFAEPLKKFPDGVPESDRKRLHDEIIAAIDTNVRPAYEKFAKFVATEYAPHGRTEMGVWSLPGGEALYKWDIRQQTTTEMEPEAIHQL